MGLEPEFLADFFETVEKAGGVLHRIAVTKVTVGEGVRFPAYMVDGDGKLWGAEIERTSKWTRIMSMTDAAGRTYYHRLDPK